MPSLGVLGWTLWRAGPMISASTIRARAIGGWTFSRVMLPEAALAEGINKGTWVDTMAGVKVDDVEAAEVDVCWAGW